MKAATRPPVATHSIRWYLVALVVTVGTLIGCLVARRQTVNSAFLDATLMVPYVMPGIVDFLNRYPDASVSAVFLDRVVNLLEEGLDIGVRIGDRVWIGLRGPVLRGWAVVLEREIEGTRCTARIVSPRVRAPALRRTAAPVWGDPVNLIGSAGIAGWREAGKKTDSVGG